MAAGRNEFVAMMVVELEDGDSYSDVGYQDVDEGGSDVTSHQRHFSSATASRTSCSLQSALSSHESHLAIQASVIT
jgi:hypothetical protein